jgi:hypothetical protein
MSPEEAAVVAAWNAPRPQVGDEDYWEVTKARSETLIAAMRALYEVTDPGSALLVTLLDAISFRETLVVDAEREMAARSARRGLGVSASTPGVGR